MNNLHTRFYIIPVELLSSIEASGLAIYQLQCQSGVVFNPWRPSPSCVNNLCNLKFRCRVVAYSALRDVNQWSIYCQLENKVKLESKYNDARSGKCSWIFRLQNGCPFVSASVCWVNLMIHKRLHTFMEVPGFVFVQCVSCFELIV